MLLMIAHPIIHLCYPPIQIDEIFILNKVACMSFIISLNDFPFNIMIAYSISLVSVFSQNFIPKRVASAFQLRILIKKKVYFHPEYFPGLNTDESFFVGFSSTPYRFSVTFSIFPLNSGSFGNNWLKELTENIRKRDVIKILMK